MAKHKSVLFICTGNINRSPAAEIILKQICKERSIDLCVESRALSPYNNGKRMTKAMRRALGECGYGEDHDNRSRPLTQEDINTFDLLLYMDKANDKRFKKQFTANNNAYKFGEYLGTDVNVPDPHFHKGIEKHIEVVRMLESMCQKLTLSVTS